MTILDNSDIFDIFDRSKDLFFHFRKILFGHCRHAAGNDLGSGRLAVLDVQGQKHDDKTTTM